MLCYIKSIEMYYNLSLDYIAVKVNSSNSMKTESKNYYRVSQKKTPFKDF